MGNLYIDTGGATTNSGSRDSNTAALSGTGASNVGTTVNLPAGTDLSSVQTSGANQDTIYLNDATNANRKIFWITAKDDTLDTVTVDVEPSGIVSSSWAIGGRMVLTPANYEAAMRPGDTVTFNNSPAARSVAFITTRVAGTGTGGYVKFVGKTGTRPVFNITNTANVLIGTGGQALNWWENFELDQDGASGNVIAGLGPGGILHNLKVSDGGGIGYNTGDTGTTMIASEITGVAGVGISASVSTLVKGCYIHDGSSDGILQTGAGPVTIISANIIDTCAGRGINDSGAPTTAAHLLLLDGNTVYGCGDSGLEIADADRHTILINSIFSENGNAAGEYNVEWVAGSAELGSFHAWNVFFHSDDAGGSLLNLIVNAQVASSEFTTDPQFTATRSTLTATSASPCVFTVTAGATPSNNNSGTLSAGTGGALPTGFTAGTTYYVVNVSGNTFQLSLTLGGAGVNSSSTGTAPFFFHTSAIANFAISSTSPAKAAGFPGQFLGGSLGYLDIGAVQRQEPAGGGGASVHRIP